MNNHSNGVNHNSVPKNSIEVQAIRHIDHVTYVAPPQQELEFINRWGNLGFNELVRLQTVRYPATHIALTSGVSEEFPWATMTGLSVSTDLHSPINIFIQRYGSGIQHTAYNIHPKADMELLEKDLTKLGWRFMTPVLTYQDDTGAHLRQMFSAPSKAFGTFIEFVQRLPGSDGSAYNGFDTTNIDDLYEHYSDYSQWLDHHPKAQEKLKEKILETHHHINIKNQPKNKKEAYA